MVVNEKVKNCLVAPCGIQCGECECYEAKNNPELIEYLVSKGIDRNRLPCKGCREVKGECPAMSCTCETYTCTTEHNVKFCFECREFPCDKLNPSVDRANSLPHNMKIINLCYIEHHGLDQFLERSPQIKQRYFKGKMVIGKGPQL